MTQKLTKTSKQLLPGNLRQTDDIFILLKLLTLRVFPEIASNFRETAEGETGHAHGHLDYLKTVGDPATGLPIGETLENLQAAVEGETHEYTDMYPGMAKTARDEGFMKSQIGLKLSQKQRNLMQADFSN
ncbi:MAG: hypothetical protein Ct9H300mP28_34510 [Pseudomonadota bacterium]|nr:MAG: hypothetical protein Ct9H300mP28_34510 [Pseudomonadota bacterium]